MMQIGKLKNPSLWQLHNNWRIIYWWRYCCTSGSIQLTWPWFDKFANNIFPFSPLAKPTVLPFGGTHTAPLKNYARTVRVTEDSKLGPGGRMDRRRHRIHRRGQHRVSIFGSMAMHSTGALTALHALCGPRHGTWQLHCPEGERENRTSGGWRGQKNTDKLQQNAFAHWNIDFYYWL